MKPRNPKDGQYVDRNFDKLCECGHRLGDHTAAHPRDCLKCEAEDKTCEGFKKKRA